MIIFKSNVKFQNAVNDIKQLTWNFNQDDFVVNIAGTNDVLDNTLVNKSLIEKTTKNIHHTKAVTIGTFFRKIIICTTIVFIDNFVVHCLVYKVRFTPNFINVNRAGNFLRNKNCQEN